MVPNGLQSVTLLTVNDTNANPLMNDCVQAYLLRTQSGSFPKILMRLLKLCKRGVTLYPERATKRPESIDNPEVSQVVVATLITTMKVLIALTHGAGKEGELCN